MPVWHLVYDLPKTLGIETLQGIKKIPEHPPVILLSGRHYTHPEHRTTDLRVNLIRSTSYVVDWGMSG